MKANNKNRRNKLEDNHRELPDEETMAQFSRRTILAATDLLTDRTHSEIDRFALEHGIEAVAQGPSRVDKTNAIGRYLIQNPLVNNEYGENLSDSVVIAILGRAIERSFNGYPAEFSFADFQASFSALHRGLERDGFTVEDGTLRRILPGIIDLPAADDEVHLLLDRFGFAVPKGHLDQGVTAHVRSQWAAANAQFRTFIESLLDEIALRAPARREDILRLDTPGDNGWPTSLRHFS